MDEVAPRIRRSDRPMASPDAGRGGDGRRRGSGGPATLEPTDDGNLSFGRRIGVLVVLAALGGAIILAAGGVGGGKPVTPIISPSVRASGVVAGTPRPQVSPPTGVPAIAPLKVSLLDSRSVDLRLTVPEPGTTMTGLEVRIYRNSKILKTKAITHTGRIKVNDVPLRRGVNRLTAVLANDGGEGSRSASVSVTVDDQAPRVVVKSPKSGATINQQRITLTGRTEPGLTVTARNATSGSTATMTAGPSGVFGLELALAPGRNAITVRARDAAGNLGTTPLVIVRGDGHASVELRLTHRTLQWKTLPVMLNARVTVRDADGRLVDGAQVSFSITPPGQLTSTYSATTGPNGTATWSGIRVTRKGTTRGDGSVTARVQLPRGGGSADKTLHFQVE
jgi:hypothetical protein